MKAQLLQAMKGFILGGGTGVTVALTGLALWTGTTDLQTIKESVEQYTIKADGQVSALLGEYNVTVNNANAEIGEYKVALQQANDNISQLITAYETKVDELESANSTYEQDMKDLQAEYDKMVQKINLDYKLDMNEVVEKANEQINKANEDVADTKTQVQTIISGSGVSNFTIDDHKEHLNKLDVEKGKPTVNDISSVVPSEQPQN